MLTLYVPDEIWLIIFGKLKEPYDLVHIVRCCRRFKTLASEALYLDIRWLNISHVLQNFAFWDTQPNLLNLPLKLTLGIPWWVVVESSGEPCSVGDGRWLAAIKPDFIARPLGAHPDIDFYILYSQILSRVANFPALQELTLLGAALPPIVYTVFELLPRLTRLIISRCILSPIKYQSYLSGALFDLPLQHLRMEQNTIFAPDPDNDPYQICPFNLLTAKNIRHLEFAWDGCIPEAFDGFRLEMPRVETLDVFAHQISAPDFASLISCINNCPNVGRVSISLEVHNFPESFTIPDFRLSNLHTFEGPPWLANAFMKLNKVESLHVLGLTPLSLFLDILENGERLIALALNLDKWDEEAMYAVTEVLGRLQSLTLRYAFGRPSEVRKLFNNPAH